MPLYSSRLGEAARTPQQQELIDVISQIPYVKNYATKFQTALVGTVKEAAIDAASDVVIKGLVASAILSALMLGFAMRQIKPKKKGK